MNGSILVTAAVTMACFNIICFKGVHFMSVFIESSLIYNQPSLFNSRASFSNSLKNG